MLVKCILYRLYYTLPKIQYIYSQDRRRFYINYLHEICIRVKIRVRNVFNYKNIYIEERRVLWTVNGSDLARTTRLQMRKRKREKG